MTTSLARLALMAVTVLQLAAVVVLVGLGSALLAGILPSLLGNESFVVADRDMQPALQVGDLAIVGPIRGDAVTVGDVVIYRTPQDPNFPLTRRILSRETDSASGLLNLQTRGDSNPSAEQVNVAPSAILGRLVYSVPRLGLLVSFANTMRGKIVLLALPGALLVSGWLRSRLRRRRRTGGLSLDDTKRIQALLDSGHRALSAGFPQLAVRAANGVLTLDSSNEAAVFLKVQAIQAREGDREYVAA
jgi:signal peptidase I